MTQSVVLIADDEADAADLLGVLLGLHFPRAAVRIAHGGQAGLDLAMRERPDAAVLDLECRVWTAKRSRSLCARPILMPYRS